MAEATAVPEPGTMADAEPPPDLRGAERLDARVGEGERSVETSFSSRLTFLPLRWPAVELSILLRLPRLEPVVEDEPWAATLPSRSLSRAPAELAIDGDLRRAELKKEIRSDRRYWQRRRAVPTHFGLDPPVVEVPATTGGTDAPEARRLARIASSRPASASREFIVDLRLGLFALAIAGLAAPPAPGRGGLTLLPLCGGGESGRV